MGTHLLASLGSKGKIGTLLLASEMPVPIPRSRTVSKMITFTANMAVYPYKQRLQPGNEGSGVCVALFSELLAPTPEVT